MLLHVAQYAFVFWILVGENEADVLRLRQTEIEDKNMYVKAACTVKCLQQQRKLATTVTLLDFRNCYDKCRSINTADVSLQQLQENQILTLTCREENGLTFSIKNHSNPNNNNQTIETTQIKNDNVIYFIKVHSASDDYDQIYLSDEEFFQLRNLSANTRYDITAAVVHADYKYSVIAKAQQYLTLQRNYIPKNIFDIQIISFQADSNNNTLISASLHWRPPITDDVCYYEIICYSVHDSHANYRVVVDIRNLRKPYFYEIPQLKFASQYTVGIRSKTSRDRNKESNVFWQEIYTPTCTKLHGNNFHICPPLTPSILNVVQVPLPARDEFSLRIAWYKPEVYPDYYILRLFLLKDSGKALSFTIKNKTDFHYIPNIKLDCPEIEIHLSAYTAGGNSTDVTFRHVSPWMSLKQETSYFILKKVFISLVMLLFSVTLILLSLSICGWQSKLKYCYNRCQFYNEQDGSTELSQVNTDRTAFTINDSMEIDTEKVTLFEILGEGAFGRVYRGIYNDPKLGFFEVAVKMLKGRDVNAFCHEIDMMKSVKKHPNIVGIIGHCTKDIHNMLLLTEYCCLGNLLFFLREECKNLHNTENDLQLLDKTYNGEVNNIVTNCKVNDSNSKKTSLDFIATPCLKIIEGVDMTCDKTASLNTYQQLVPISVENLDYFQTCPHTNVLKKEPLNATSLLNISIQIANGMEFLGKNKVVHRDLAARNVLLTANKVVKIADFGLSRDVYQDNIYKKCGNGKLPIKWLALESLTHQIYTTKSDIWSYGILLYEIITLGENPYPSLDTRDLLYMLKSGYRMEKPANCGDHLYQLMRRCWHTIPAERPSFSDIIKILETILDDAPEDQIKNLPAPKNCKWSTIEEINKGYLSPL